MNVETEILERSKDKESAPNLNECGFKRSLVSNDQSIKFIDLTKFVVSIPTEVAIKVTQPS